MKKYYIVLTVTALASLALGWLGTSSAYAQSPTPPAPNSPPGPGISGGRGGFSRGMMSPNRDTDPLYEYMQSAIASAFGLTPDEVEIRIDNGETMWQIAQAQGLTADEFYTKLSQAWTEAINKAVADGAISQDFADGMLQRMGQMWRGGTKGGFGPSGCQGSNAGFG